MKESDRIKIIIINRKLINCYFSILSSNSLLSRIGKGRFQVFSG